MEVVCTDAMQRSESKENDKQEKKEPCLDDGTMFAHISESIAV